MREPTRRAAAVPGSGLILQSEVISWVQRNINMLLETCMAENAPQLSIIVNMTRIQIVSNSSFEHRWILRNDCKATTKNSPNFAFSAFNDTEQRQCQRTLAGTSATDDTDLLMGFDIEVDFL
ncbi:hypothetical protein TMatcc_007487 [Talaromyces marneffei ATCC 18224]